MLEEVNSNSLTLSKNILLDNFQKIFNKSTQKNFKETHNDVFYLFGLS